MGQYEINRADYLILSTLCVNECTDYYHSMTISEIMDDNVDENGNQPLGARMTVYRELQKLVETGYIKKGIKDDHADTYYANEISVAIIKNGGMRV